MTKGSLDLETERSFVALAKAVYFTDGVESIGTYIKE